ncbi:RICIN domain-containing protein [Dactylosporangium sp. NPDC049742]|uniref:RICIN domain-containing protein n=1 Tax=Dactylosporangium sp. NPDC049742 TaxID=3154737 RepID=UPI003438136F
MSIRARLAAITALAVLAPPAVLVAGSPATAAPPKPPACADTATGAQTARDLARRCDRRVEDLTARTESTQVFANADGTSTLQASVVPQRVKRTDGSWAPIDVNLVRSGKGFVPKASTMDVQFSAGGNDPLVTVADKGRTFTLGWPAALPAPQVNGDSATYPGVFTGVDLVVTATATGFTHVLVVHDAAAAANPALRRIRYTLGGTGVKVTRTADGGVDVTGVDGKPMLTSGAAVMWDSGLRGGSAVKQGAASASASASAADAAEPSTVRGASDRARKATAATEVSQSELVLQPDRALLGGADFPLFIDPAFHSPSASRWAYSNNANENNDTSTVRMGKSPDSGAIYRPLFEFPVGVLSGSIVTSATFQIQLYHSWSCSATTATLWRANGIAATPKNPWANSGVNTYLDAQSAAANKDTCYTANQPMMYFSGNLTGDVQAVANAAWANYTLALSAMDSAGNGESTGDRWKKFNVNTAVLIVNYNHVPRTPTLAQLSIDPSAVCTAGTVAVNTRSGLTLRAALSDPNNDNLKAQWQVTGIPAQYAPADSGYATAGDFTTTLPPEAFTDGGTYSFSVRGHDGTHAGQYSPTCSFVVDNAPPVNPTATSTDLALATGLVVPAPAANAVVGRPAAVQVLKDSHDANIAGYLYAVGEGVPAEPAIWAPAQANGNVVIPVVPRASGTTVNYLTLQARSMGGLDSARIIYKFKANAGTVARVAGDATGDGRADLTVLTDAGAGKSALWRLDLPASGAAASALAPQGVSGVYTTASVKTTQGDYDGDGLSDVAVFSTSGTNVTVSVQRSDGNGLYSSAVLATLAGWDLAKMRVLSGNYDNDPQHRDDLAVVYNDNTTVWTYRILVANGTAGTPSFAAPATWYTQPASGGADWNRMKVVAGDFDGDQLVDIGVFYDYGGCQTRMWVNYNTVASFQGIFTWDSGPGNFCWAASDQQLTGDFNADGRSDVLHVYRFGTCNMSLFVQYGNADRTVSAVVGRYASGTYTWCDNNTFQVGDFNGDGRADVGAASRCCGAYQTKFFTWTTNADGSFTGPDQRWEGGTGPFTVGSLRIEPGTRYQIVSVKSGKCLTAGADGVNIVQQTCGTGPTQTWTFDRHGSDYQRIHPVSSPSSCLEIRNGSLSQGALAATAACSGTPQQRLAGYYAGGFTDPMANLLAGHTAMCLDVIGGSLADGAQVQQLSCNGSDQQRYLLHPVP